MCAPAPEPDPVVPGAPEDSAGLDCVVGDEDGAGAGAPDKGV